MTPERTLWAEVVLLAVRDATQPPRGVRIKDRKRVPVYSAERLRARESITKQRAEA